MAGKQTDRKRKKKWRSGDMAAGLGLVHIRNDSSWRGTGGGRRKKNAGRVGVDHSPVREKKVKLLCWKL